MTLTGPGGTGKTRLALEAGARLQEAFADGVVFVDLAPLRDAEFALPTIAGTLGVRERAGQPLRETLSRVLAPKQLLLLLDNCEQVLEAAPDVAALLAASPQLSVLATSRETLRLRGEHVVPLPPLPLPSSNGRTAVTDLAQVPAVALFLERATATHPTFALTADNAAAVARHLPPSRWAAAGHRAGRGLGPRAASPHALLDRLEHRLLLLTGGSRDLPDAAAHDARHHRLEL